MNWDGLNRRKFPRVMCPCLIKLAEKENGDGVILTHTENIGIGGVCVISKKNIKNFSALEVEIDLLDAGEHLYCHGRVVWNIRRKNTEEKKPLFYDLGIEFVGISQRDAKRLEDFIQHHIKSGAKILKAYY